MSNIVLLFISCIFLTETTAQALDAFVPSRTSVITQNPSADSKWEELLPALEMFKSTSKIKKERLFNVVKIIKFLLSDETGCNEMDMKKMLEELKEAEDSYGLPLTDVESVVEERLKPIKEVIDDRTYMLKEGKKESPKNKTADYSKILSKITAALAKSKEQNQSCETQKPSMVPIFWPKSGCKDLNPSAFNNFKQLRNAPSQSEMNPMLSLSKFNIPCQRAADILEEPLSYSLPKGAFCDNLPANLNSIAKSTKLNLDNLPFDNIVPNSVSCVNSDDSIAILFKPKTISMMQMYGKLLKKITITVLVPYFVSKMAI